MSTVIFSLPKTNANQSVSNSGSTQTGGTSSFADIVNMNVSITTLGKPVLISLQPDSNSTPGRLSDNPDGYIWVRLLRDSSEIAQWEILARPMPGLWFLDITAPAGAHIYKFQSMQSTTGAQIYVKNLRTVAVEWG